jgi:allene oxide cyclase
MVMRRSLGVAIAAIGCSAALVAVTATQAASDSDPPGSGRFTVVEHAKTDTVIDNQPAGDSLGDSLAFGNPVFNARNTAEVGHDQGSCVRTEVGAAWECSWTTILRGGSIVVQGPFYDAADSTLAIIGGTGSWSQARGQMLLHARNPQGTEYDFTFVVER